MILKELGALERTELATARTQPANLDIIPYQHPLSLSPEAFVSG